MRLHITCHGKKTTISIDDILMDYLGAWLVEEKEPLHSNPKAQIDWAISFIRHYASKQADRLPTKNLSQFMQGVVIRSIASPGLSDIIKARGERFVKPKRAPKRAISETNQSVDEIIEEIRTSRLKR